MKFSVVAFAEPDGSDLTTIAVFDWPRLPRVSETLKLVGPMFGHPDECSHGEDAVVLFEVTEVVYTHVVDPGVIVPEPTTPYVEVYVEEHETYRPPMRLRCTCEKPTTENGTVCDDCGRFVSQVRVPQVPPA